MKTLWKGIIIGILLVLAEITITHEFNQARMWTKIEARVTQLEEVQGIIVQTQGKLNKALTDVINNQKALGGNR
jgi:hypothetical protein